MPSNHTNTGGEVGLLPLIAAGVLGATAFTGVILVLPAAITGRLWRLVEDVTEQIVVRSLAVWSEEIAALADADETPAAGA